MRPPGINALRISLTQIQLDEIPTAVPFARACRGKISGTYTQGIQFTDAPKANM